MVKGSMLHPLEKLTPPTVTELRGHSVSELESISYIPRSHLAEEVPQLTIKFTSYRLHFISCAIING